MYLMTLEKAVAIHNNHHIQLRIPQNGYDPSSNIVLYLKVDIHRRFNQNLNLKYKSILSMNEVIYNKD